MDRIRKITPLIILFVLVVAAASYAQQVTKIAIVNSQKAFETSSEGKKALAQLQEPVPVQQLQKICAIRTATVCSALAELSTKGEIIRDARGYQLKLPLPVSHPIDPKGNGNGKP